MKYLTVFQCVGDGTFRPYGQGSREIHDSNFVQNRVDTPTRYPVIYAITHGSHLVNCAFLENDALNFLLKNTIAQFEVAGCSFSTPFDATYVLDLGDNIISERLPSLAIYGLNTAQCLGIAAPTIRMTGGASPEITHTRVPTWSLLPTTTPTIPQTAVASPESSRSPQVCMTYNGFLAHINVTSGCCDILYCSFVDQIAESGGGVLVNTDYGSVSVRSSFFKECEASSGGGCYLFGTEINISSCCSEACSGDWGTFAYIVGFLNTTVEFTTLWGNCPVTGFSYEVVFMMILKFH
jgi:hypothetical protein